MKAGTKRSLLIWGAGILAEIIFATIVTLIAKGFDITINSMFYFIVSSLILSVCYVFDRVIITVKVKETVKEDNNDNNSEDN